MTKYQFQKNAKQQLDTPISSMNEKNNSKSQTHATSNAPAHKIITTVASNLHKKKKIMVLPSKITHFPFSGFETFTGPGSLEFCRKRSEDFNHEFIFAIDMNARGSKAYGSCKSYSHFFKSI